MAIGSAWLVYEESTDDFSRLVSVINPRRSAEYVANYISQYAVDTYGSVDEKIAFKKNARKSPFFATIEAEYANLILCNCQPLVVARFCTRMEIVDSTLRYTYKLMIADNFERQEFKEITKSLLI